MIKVVHAQWAGDSKVSLAFSDGSDGVYDFASMLSKDTALTRPLRNAEMFKRFFLELGALCWPNGLELSASKLHSELVASGSLLHSEKAA
jgi:Protein of unknown function (DUF2442)